MKSFVAVVVFVLAAVMALPVSAQTSPDVDLFSSKRLSFSLGVEKAWTFESFDVGEEVGSEWYVKVPWAYSLPTAIPSAITGRLEKSLTSRTVGVRLGFNVVVFKSGSWTWGGGSE